MVFYQRLIILFFFVAIAFVRSAEPADIDWHDLSEADALLLLAKEYNQVMPEMTSEIIVFPLRDAKDRTTAIGTLISEMATFKSIYCQNHPVFFSFLGYRNTMLWHGWYVGAPIDEKAKKALRASQCVQNWVDGHLIIDGQSYIAKLSLTLDGKIINNEIKGDIISIPKLPSMIARWILESRNIPININMTRSLSCIEFKDSDAMFRAADLSRYLRIPSSEQIGQWQRFATETNGQWVTDRYVGSVLQMYNFEPYVSACRRLIDDCPHRLSGVALSALYKIRKYDEAAKDGQLLARSFSEYPGDVYSRIQIHTEMGIDNTLWPLYELVCNQSAEKYKTWYVPLDEAASLYFYQANKARGSDWASNVSEDQWERFRDRSRAVIKATKAAIEREAGAPCVWRQMADKMYHSGIERDQALSASQTAYALDPADLRSVDAVYVFSSPRWGCNLKTAAKTIKWFTDLAPAGSPTDYLNIYFIRMMAMDCKEEIIADYRELIRTVVEKQIKSEGVRIEELIVTENFLDDIKLFPELAAAINRKRIYEYPGPGLTSPTSEALMDYSSRVFSCIDAVKPIAAGLKDWVKTGSNHQHIIQYRDVLTRLDIDSIPVDALPFYKLAKKKLNFAVMVESGEWMEIEADLSNFIVVNGNWNVAGVAIRASGSVKGPAILTLPDSSFENFEMEFDCRTDAIEGAIGGIISYRHIGYYFCSGVRIEKQSACFERTFKQGDASSYGNYSMPNGQWQRFRMVQQQGLHTLFIDGEPVLKLSLSGFRSGALGLGCYFNNDDQVSVEFQNFRIRKTIPVVEDARDLGLPELTDEKGRAWMIFGDPWQEKQGALIGNTQKETWLIHSETHPDDFRLTAEFTVRRGSEISLWFAGNPASRDSAGYFISVKENDKAVLQRAGVNLVYSDQARIVKGKKHILAIERQGSTIKAYLDGSLFIDWSDPAPIRGQDHRTCGLYIWNGALSVRDFYFSTIE
ncbi:MAG: hypothetical protein ABIH86_01165 [Planctomycetota bacterium]